jgi:REP element-mobilizing transposase RayT
MTICAHNRKCLFGEMTNGKIPLNDIGEIFSRCWHAIPKHFCYVTLDAFMVIPNHIHGIIIINNNNNDNVGARHASPPQERPSGPEPQSIGAIVGSFKSAVTKHINEIRATTSAPVWQRNYYEHIIRNDDSLNVIRQYILDNPAAWDVDDENPANMHKIL